MNISHDVAHVDASKKLKILEMYMCECAHSFAQRFLISKRLRCIRHEDEMLWHKMERAVQCAGAGIDSKDKVDTDPFSFRSQTVTQQKGD